MERARYSGLSEERQAETERLRTEAASLRSELSSRREKRWQLWQEFLKADQQCRDCEQSLSKIDERLAQNKEAAEQLSKEKAELDTRFAGVNEVLSRLRSQPMVDPAAESAATLAADQAIKMKDGVLAALARFQSELSS